MRTLLILPFALLAAGCAGNVEVAYPEPAGAGETGDVLVRLTEPMASVSVVVDGVLLVEDEHTERVEIRDVPAGDHALHVAASASNRSGVIDHAERVTVEAGRTATVLLATPPMSSGYWVQQSLFWLWPVVWILAER